MKWNIQVNGEEKMTYKNKVYKLGTSIVGVNKKWNVLYAVQK